jgi:hypothetical protein
VSHDRSLERWVLLQDVAVVVVSLCLAYAVHGLLLAAWPMLKPTVPLLYYAPILLAFLPRGCGAPSGSTSTAWRR